MILLVFEAAHQAVAQAGNLRRVERKILLLRHLDGDRREIAQKRPAADRPPARADSAEHLRLVAHADLAQLNAGLENTRQTLDQHAEIHAAVGGEIENDFGSVERIFHVHQLHFQLVLGNAVDGDVKRLFFRLLVSLLHGQILLGGDAENRLERQNQALIRHIHHAAHAFAQLHAPRRLRHNAHAVVQLQPVGVKVV